MDRLDEATRRRLPAGRLMATGETPVQVGVGQGSAGEPVPVGRDCRAALDDRRLDNCSDDARLAAVVRATFEVNCEDAIDQPAG